MRENKYKVWCKNNNEWEKGKMMLFCDGSLAQLKNGLIIPCKQETHIIVFYTGLLDKNSKEIYEGDIVKDSIHDRCGVVRWGKFNESDGEHCPRLYGFFVQYNTKNAPDDTMQSELLGKANGEVIGTIYKNPKLLK